MKGIDRKAERIMIKNKKEKKVLRDAREIARYEIKYLNDYIKLIEIELERYDK